MEPMTSVTINTVHGPKSIEIVCSDIKELDEKIDLFTVSAFYRSYAPTPGTLQCALKEVGIDNEALSENPVFDLRETNNIWISDKITGSRLPIERLGCIETTPYTPNADGWRNREKSILDSIQAYFSLIDIATLAGIKIDTLALPILGGGNQKIPVDMILIPMINECMKLLKQNHTVHKIMIISKNPNQAYKAAKCLENSYSVLQNDTDKFTPSGGSQRKDQSRRRAFISYSSKDRELADIICSKLEAQGVKVWYAPRNVHGDYASSIVEAISECNYFVCILSANSFQSGHVLNEVDLAFQETNRDIRLMLIKIDNEEMSPAFRYYLSRQHWVDAHVPPIDERIDEFVRRILE